MTVEILTDVSDAEVRSFLDEAPGANIFQSPDLLRVYGKTKGYRPCVIAAESAGRIRGLLSSAVVSYSTGRLSALTARAIVIGGPLGDVSLFPSLLAAHDQNAAKAVLLTQVRNLTSPPDRGPFERAGYRWEDHLNFQIDISKGEQTVLAKMSKARRKGITHAERTGFELRELGFADLGESYALLKATYSRNRVPLADISLFEAALDDLAPSGHLLALGAGRQGELMAVRFVLRWGRTLYDWYAGSGLEPPVHADELLVWEVLRRGIREGCTSFDFGGAGKPKEPYGPREFKRRFGGQAGNPGRFEKVYRPITLRAAKAAYKAWRILQ